MSNITLRPKTIRVAQDDYDAYVKASQRISRDFNITLRPRFEPQPPPEGEKWCARCQDYRPFEAFPIDQSRPDGLHQYCAEHKNALSRKQYWRRKDRARLKVFLSILLMYHPECRAGEGVQLAFILIMFDR